MPLDAFDRAQQDVFGVPVRGGARWVFDRWSALCHGPRTKASRTMSQPVSVCQVVSTISPPGR